MSQSIVASLPLVYIVDDDDEVRALLKQYLEKNGLEIVGFATADELLRRMVRRRPDLVVMDLMMPGTFGLDALRQLRREGDDVPLIFLTALSDEPDRIAGLDLGADDYLGKPFNPRELLSRIHAVLRRRAPTRHPLPEIDQPIAIGPFVLDPLKRTLSREGKRIKLSHSNFAILRALVSSPLKPWSRDRLLEIAGRCSREQMGRSIDLRILRLRRMIESDPDSPTILQTVRGFGYVYVPH